MQVRVMKKIYGVRKYFWEIKGCENIWTKNKGCEKKVKGCENIFEKFKGCENIRIKKEGVRKYPQKK